MQVYDILATNTVDLQTLIKNVGQGQLERHIFYSFMLIKETEKDGASLSSLRENVFVTALTTPKFTLLTGSLSDWKRTIEFYLLDNPNQGTEEKHTICKIVFLLENKFKLFPFFKEYKKVKLADTSFYLKRI